MALDPSVSERTGTAAFVRYWLPVGLYAGLIFFLSSQTHPEDDLPGFLFRDVSDKVLHAVEYGVLALLCARAARHAGGSVLAPRAMGFAIVAASLYGMTDELHQAFVPPREASALDWVADTVGAAVAAWLWNRSDRS